MNKTKYLQRDGRWGGLPYPKKPCYIRAVGCGEVSIANVIIEMEQYAQYTPATIQPYCKQYGAPNCDGTYLSGICKMMKHYGMTEVKECDTMPELWKELEKGNRVAIYLMGSRRGGSKRIHWTSGGHFVASVNYKVENGKHYVYMKDPWTDDKNRNGWITYEGNMKGDVVGVYVGKLVQKKAKPSDGKLSVDGIGGTATIKATQKFFGKKQDGFLGDQIKKLNKYYPSIAAVKYGKGKKGSTTVKALQKWLGITPDGIIGKGTTAAWQHKLRDLGYLAKDEKIDGLFGVKSMKAWQRFLNDHLGKEEEKKPEPTPTPTPTPTPAPTPAPPKKTVDELAQEVLDGKWGSGKDRKEKLTKAGYDYDAVQNKVNEILKAKEDPLQPWYDALKTQYEWSKKQKYKFNKHPNVANSKKEGTCITFVAVALQRLGLLPKGKWFWLYPKTKKIDGNADKYVKKHPEIFEVFYPWKTIAELHKEDRIKKGDIIGFDKPDHTMVFKGFNKSGDPIFDTMGHKRGLNVTYPSYAKRKVGMIVRLKKVVK